VLRRIFGRYLVLPLPFTVLFPSGFPEICSNQLDDEGLAVYFGVRLNQATAAGAEHFEGMMRAERARACARSRGETPKDAAFRSTGLSLRQLFLPLPRRALRPGRDSQVCRDLQRRWFRSGFTGTPRFVTGKAMDELWLEYHEC